jgi:hypothetical protein
MGKVKKGREEGRAGGWEREDLRERREGERAG